MRMPDRPGPRMWISRATSSFPCRSLRKSARSGFTRPLFRLCGRRNSFGLMLRRCCQGRRDRRNDFGPFLLPVARDTQAPRAVRQCESPWCSTLVLPGLASEFRRPQAIGQGKGSKYSAESLAYSFRTPLPNRAGLRSIMLSVLQDGSRVFATKQGPVVSLLIRRPGKRWDRSSSRLVSKEHSHPSCAVM
jgi:hypothetical protein